MRAFALALLFCFFIQFIEGQSDEADNCAWVRRKTNTSASTWSSRKSVAEKDVHFIFYNRQRYLEDYPNETLLSIDDESTLRKGGFDVKKPTKIVVPGYKSFYKRPICVILRDAFLKSGDFNVIIIDWGASQRNKLKQLLPYEEVVDLMSAVAEHVSRFLRFLEKSGVDLSTTTMVGHSIGAHIAGAASRKVDSKIGRLVALDPAAPIVSDESVDVQMSRNDAMQVEVIHTEIDKCGFKNPMGHYDFYPNGGLDQPGCATKLCSHSKVYYYFGESLGVRSKGFYGSWCESWRDMQHGNCSGEVAPMGGLLTKTTRPGFYHVKVNEQEPYAQGRPLLRHREGLTPRAHVSLLANSEESPRSPSHSSLPLASPHSTLLSISFSLFLAHWHTLAYCTTG